MTVAGVTALIHRLRVAAESLQTAWQPRVCKSSKQLLGCAISDFGNPGLERVMGIEPT